MKIRKEKQKIEIVIIIVMMILQTIDLLSLFEIFMRFYSFIFIKSWCLLSQFKLFIKQYFPSFSSFGICF